MASRISDYLRAHREDIVGEWELAARAIAGPDKLSEPELRDDIPPLLASIADWLDAHDRDSALDFADKAAKHALSRAHQEVNLPAVVAEYRVMRSILGARFATLADVSLDDVLRVHAAIDHAIAAAVDRYARGREDVLRLQHARIEAALEAAEVGTWRLDLAAGELHRDASLNRLLGGEAVATTSGSTALYDFVHPDDQQRVVARFDSARRSGPGAIFDEVYRVVQPGGTVRWVRDHGRVVADAAGQAAWVTGAAADITGRKSAEEDRDLFIAVLAHDLANPLQALTVAIDVLVARGEASLARPLGKMALIVGRMGRLVTDVLDFARSRVQGGMMIRRRPTDLAEVCADAADEVEVAHPGAEIQRELDREVTGSFDGPRLGQVVTNLLGNAVRHGTQPISLRVAADGAQAIIEVRNAGRPVPPELMDRLFDPFKRASSRRSGTGLGLFIADHIVRAHGGSITVASDAERGTCFLVRLPR
jgi:PAS domain S-box-containing protein